MKLLQSIERSVMQNKKAYSAKRYLLCHSSEAAAYGDCGLSGYLPLASDPPSSIRATYLDSDPNSSLL